VEFTQSLIDQKEKRDDQKEKRIIKLGVGVIEFPSDDEVWSSLMKLLTHSWSRETIESGRRTTTHHFPKFQRLSVRRFVGLAATS
jgi:hypothetical protein